MGLRAFVIRRLLLLIPTLIGVSLLIFLVLQLVPATQRAVAFVSSERQLQEIDAIIAKYGLNEPVYIQYYHWISSVLQGNLGWSRFAREPVLSALVRRLPGTIEITAFTAPIVIIAGIFLGVWSAVHRDKLADHVTRVFSIIGWSLPSFWFGIVLLSIFYQGLGLFPPGRLTADPHTQYAGFRLYTGLYTIDGLLNGLPQMTLDALRHLVLPVTTLVVIQIAILVRIMRSSMLEALSKSYIIAARAKGLTQREVINKHARRNALIPAITLSGLLVAGMLNGVVITETIFQFNGVGFWAAGAARIFDIPAVLGFALFSGTLFILANLMVDILYAYIDPRIRLE